MFVYLFIYIHYYVLHIWPLQGPMGKDSMTVCRTFSHDGRISEMVSHRERSAGESPALQHACLASWWTACKSCDVVGLESCDCTPTAWSTMGAFMRTCLRIISRIFCTIYTCSKSCMTSSPLGTCVQQPIYATKELTRNGSPEHAYRICAY